MTDAHDDHPGEPRWVCPNCGQTYFGSDPPDMCDYCADFTTWRRLPWPGKPPYVRRLPHPEDD